MVDNPRIALTGATGRIGRQILQYLLENGYSHIRCLYRKDPPGPADPRIQWVQGDLLDVFSMDDLLEDADTVIHAAGLLSFNAMDKARLFKVNGEGTGNLVNASLHAGVRHLIHISSTAALGRPPVLDRLDEQTEWVKSPWNTPYGESKYNAELEVWRGREEGVGVSILNPGLVLDPEGRTRDTRAMMEPLQSGSPYYPPGSNCFVDVRDIARFVGDRIQNKPIGERVILSSENLTYQELLTRLAVASGHKAPDRLMSRQRAMLLSYGKSLFGMTGLSPQEVMLAYLNIQVDASVSREKYGFQYTPVDTSIQDIAGLLNRK